MVVWTVRILGISIKNLHTEGGLSPIMGDKLLRISFYNEKKTAEKQQLKRIKRPGTKFGSVTY
jgi:hypothetical protein